MTNRRLRRQNPPTPGKLRRIEPPPGCISALILGKLVAAVAAQIVLETHSTLRGNGSAHFTSPAFRPTNGDPIVIFLDLGVLDYTHAIIINQNSWITALYNVSATTREEFGRTQQSEGPVK
jgi:hypothetical protein